MQSKNHMVLISKLFYKISSSSSKKTHISVTTANQKLPGKCNKNMPIDFSCYKAKIKPTCQFFKNPPCSLYQKKKKGKSGWIKNKVEQASIKKILFHRHSVPAKGSKYESTIIQKCQRIMVSKISCNPCYRNV